MKRTQQAFTLVELMIVITIVGILSAIAVPTYQDYSIRSKVTELVMAAGSHKNTIAEAAQANSTLTNSGLGLTVVVGGKVSGGRVTDDGLVQVIGSSTTVGTTVSIVLRPSLQGDGKVIWECGTSGTSANFRYVPYECRH